MTKEKKDLVSSSKLHPFHSSINGMQCECTNLHKYVRAMMTRIAQKNRTVLLAIQQVRQKKPLPFEWLDYEIFISDKKTRRREREKNNKREVVRIRCVLRSDYLSLRTYEGYEIMLWHRPANERVQRLLNIWQAQFAHVHCTSGYASLFDTEKNFIVCVVRMIRYVDRDALQTVICTSHMVHRIGMSV